MKTSDVKIIDEAIELIKSSESLKKARKKAIEISENLIKLVNEKFGNNDPKSSFLLALILFIVNRDK